MIVTVASGKCGTGKTYVAVNMALSVGNLQLLDCEVEEHLEMNKKELVYESIPKIGGVLFDVCGECTKFCKVNAVFVSSKSDEPLGLLRSEH